jgi:hypothetical protein
LQLENHEAVRPEPSRRTNGTRQVSLKRKRDKMSAKISRRRVLRDISLFGAGLPIAHMAAGSELRAQPVDSKPGGAMVSKPIFSLAERNRRWEAVRRIIG